MPNKLNQLHGAQTSIMVLLAHTMVVGTLFVAIQVVALPAIVPCSYPAGQSFVAAVVIVLILQLLVGRKLFPRYNLLLLGTDIILILLAVWLGLYPFSLLGPSGEFKSVIQGFRITTANKGTLEVVSGEIVSLTAGSAIAISPNLLAGEARCDWSSANGGALDNPQGCDTYYVPPPSDYDILKISVRPGCGLPNSIGEIKVSILP